MIESLKVVDNPIPDGEQSLWQSLQIYPEQGIVEVLRKTAFFDLQHIWMKFYNLWRLRGFGEECGLAP